MQAIFTLEKKSREEILFLEDKHNLTSDEVIREALSLYYETAIAEDAVELDDSAIDAVVQDMLHAALAAEFDKTYLVPWLYRQAGAQPTWRALSPNTRKAIGRRFKKATEAYNAQADDVEVPIIKFDGRNTQNAAMYKTVLP